MNFKILGKNNMGAAGLLLLLVLLSQSKMLNFAMNTALGRAFLIAIILILSCMHKILGVVSVFIIIIMFSHSDFNYLEGMTSGIPSNTVTNTNTSMENTPTMSSTPATVPPTISALMKPKTTSTTTTTTMPTTMSMPTTTMSMPTTTMSTPTTTMSMPATTTTTSMPSVSAPSTSTSAVEGFDIHGKERLLQRGRNSNSIPVNDGMRESQSVAPYEGTSSFSSSYYSF